MINVLMDLKSRRLSLEENMQAIVQKFAEMERDLNLIAMTVIQEITMDVMLSARLKTDILVKVDPA